MASRKRRLIVTILVVLAISLAALALLRPKSPEPTYQGRPLRAWLEEFDHGSTTTNFAAAGEAIRAMGTNVLPILIRYLQAKDPPFYRQWLALKAKLELLHGTINYAVDWHIRAAAACGELGSAGAPAFPAMTRAMNEDHAAADDVAWALSRMFPASAPILTNILATGTVTARCRAADALDTASSHRSIEEMGRVALLRALQDDPDDGVRASAASALHGWIKRPDVVVPALTKALRDPSPIVRGNAATSLGELGSAAQTAVPALLELLGDTNAYLGPTDPVSNRARAMLLKIDPTALSEP